MTKKELLKVFSKLATAVVDVGDKFEAADWALTEYLEDNAAMKVEKTK